VNVTCDKCNKRYSIADEKVRGKSVKIRCKQCQNLISVQGPPVSGAPVSAMGVSSPMPETPAWAEERTRAMPILDTSSPTWFAMVKGKQVGPMTLRDLEGKVKAQEVSLRTYLWKQGMADWKRASEVPEVSPVFAGVSVGAAATGPTRAAPSAAKPISRSTSAVQRDVAIANEVPVPEITRSPKGPAKANGNGHGPGHEADDTDPYDRDARTVLAAPVFNANEKPKTKTSTGSRGAVAKPASESAAKVVERPEPHPQPVAPQPEPSPLPNFDMNPDDGGLPTVAAEVLSRPIHNEKAPLNDLFADLPGSGSHNKHDAPAGEEQQRLEPTTDPGATGGDGQEQKPDPFAALGDIDPSELPPPGEATKFFIAKAGVNKRNPPWKIALFVMGGLGIPVAILFLLSTLHVVPPVLVENEQGEMVEQAFFTPQGLSVGIKDLLSGEAKKKRAEAERRKSEAEAKAKAAEGRKEHGQGNDAAAIGGRRGEEKGQKFTQTELAKLYGSGGPSGSDVTLGAKSDVGPKVRIESSAPTIEKGGGLDQAAVNKVMSERMKALTGCVEDALKRNPNVKLEKTMLVIDVAQSGAVKAAELSPKRIELTDWGGCIRDRARKIVFPAADGESQIEIPLVLGAQVN
jgi:predicted Zn finger-like uncharacterized protein